MSDPHGRINVVERKEMEMRKFFDEECEYCIRNKGGMCPPHEASSNCQSNGYNHCTCGVCF